MIGSDIPVNSLLIGVRLTMCPHLLKCDAGDPTMIKTGRRESHLSSSVSIILTLPFVFLGE